MSLIPAIRRMTGSVGVRIALVSVLMIGPLAAYQVAAVLSLRNIQLQHTLDHLDDFASLSADNLESAEQEISWQANALATIAPTLDDAMSCKAALWKLARREATLAAYDGTGALLCSVGPLSGTAATWQPAPSIRVVDEADQATVVATAPTAAGRIAWVAAATPLHLTEKLRWTGMHGGRPILHILNDDQTALLTSMDGLTTAHREDPGERAALRMLDGRGRFTDQSKDVLAAFRTLESGFGRLHIIAEFPTTDALAPARREAQRTILVWLALVGTTSLMGWFATRHLVTKRVKGIASYAESVADGDLKAPLPAMPSGGELGRMTRSLQRSMARLAAREGALMLSLEHWRVLAEHVSDVITRTSADGRLLYVSPASLVVMGYSPDEMLGHSWAEFVHPADRERMVDNCRQLVSAPLDQSCMTFRFVRPDGTICWIEANCTTQSDPAGKMVFVSAARDVTDKTRAEEELRRNESLFRTMAECAPVIIWVTDQNMSCSYANRACLEFLGWSPGEIMGKGWMRAVHPDDLSRQGVRFRAAFRRLNQVTQLFRVRRKDGLYRSLIVSGAPRIDPDGKFLGYVGSAIDVTDQYAAEQALREQWSLLRSIIDALPEALVVADADGRIRQANPAASAMFRIPADELVGRPLGDPFPPPGAGEDAAQRIESLSVVQPFRRNDGTAFMGETVVAPIVDDRGLVTGHVKLIRDVTAEIKAARETHAARQAAEQANASKTRFLAAASHDLRQPLHAINLFLDSLGRRVSGAEAMDLVGNIRASLASLNEMFAQLLDISRLEAGFVSPEPKDVEIGRIMGIITPPASRLALERGLQLRVRSCQAVIRTDPLLCERILRNLVTNAIRYTRRGGVLLGCRQRGTTLRVEVWDTGRGIPPDRLDDVFSEFRRIEEDADDHRGLGLGLTIVRRLADLLGHRITVASRPGRGSVFALELPLGDPTALTEVNKVDRLARGTVAGTIVAVIDDEPTVVDSMRQLLGDWGCRPVAARRVGDLLSALERAGRPDIILADYRLKGGITGVMVVERIRSEFGANIPAIIITADTHRTVQQTVTEAGCRLLLKPLPPPRLRSLMTQLLHPLEAAG